ncbi:piggyBac transposable element-derived protein 4-like [Acipenser ruthenus]|uniref:piggyBac transposable element-derived protein 4-like n=1 Tax=Acipenser ruthenus TaxID=7906 RepID=UPI0027413C13|nr:piggyBac transposable element-derived protein 4-like [Acipenser ruthenus]
MATAGSSTCSEKKRSESKKRRLTREVGFENVFEDSESDSSDMGSFEWEFEYPISDGIDDDGTATPEPEPAAYAGSTSTPTVSVLSEAQSSNKWHCSTQSDYIPNQPKFRPARQPGISFDKTITYTDIDLFKLFFSKDTVAKICSNTNKQGEKQQKKGKKYPWKPLGVQEFYTFLAVVIFMGIVRMPTLQEYWTDENMYGSYFCKSVMSRNRFLPILWNLHMSDPDEDAENDRKKGQPDYDPLFRLRPLLDNINFSCRAYYHPQQHVSIDERMVASKARLSMMQHIKDKPTKWGVKMFVLADSTNGYTCNFQIYTGKRAHPTPNGLRYDTVMSVLDCNLGYGYKLYCDNFYTSPKLFTDLYGMNFAACGTVGDHTKGCPRTKENALTKKSERGSIRWLREGPLLFVKWMDTREVSMCSTIHAAYQGAKVSRRVKLPNGSWQMRNVDIPEAIQDYNRNMGGVDRSDQLIQYCNVVHKTKKWYKTLFFHFLDIAIVNSFLLHKELCQVVGKMHESQVVFRKKLLFELCGEQLPAEMPSSSSAPASRMMHLPAPIVDPASVEKGQKASAGRRKCQHCKDFGRGQMSTPWQCKTCNVPLCLVLDRNCFIEWHRK